VARATADAHHGGQAFDFAQHDKMIFRIPSLGIDEEFMTFSRTVKVRVSNSESTD
jgi:hypothetical protein